jgi:hypothetical protein
MSIVYKKYIPIGITAITGVIVLFDYYVKIPEINSASTILTSWGTHLSYFAVLISALMIVRQSIPKIIKQEKDWYFYGYMLTILIIMSATGFISGIASSNYSWWYNNFYGPVSTTLMAIMGIYLMSASYRAFRIRSVPVFGAMIACIVVLIATAPAGPVWFPWFGALSQWIQAYPSQAGIRAFTMAAAIGTLASGIRTLIGLEIGFLGAKEDKD